MSFNFSSISGITGHVCYGHNEHRKGLVQGGYALCYGPKGQLRGSHFEIHWQDGPVKRDGKADPNGAFVEDVLKVCRIRP